MMTFFRAGFAANLPVAAYGSVLGILAAQKGIGWVAPLVPSGFLVQGGRGELYQQVTMA